MRTSAKVALLFGLCFGFYVSRSRKFASKLVDIAEEVQDRVTTTALLRMIDVVLGEITHNTVVSAARMSDFLLDMRSAVMRLEDDDTLQKDS